MCLIRTEGRPQGMRLSWIRVLDTISLLAVCFQLKASLQLHLGEDFTVRHSIRRGSRAVQKLARTFTTFHPEMMYFDMSSLVDSPSREPEVH